MNRLEKLFSQLFDRISLQDKINFARHLSLIIKAGLPLYQGLGIIRTQTNSRALLKVINSVMEDVNNGKFLADALEKFEHLFGTFFINIIRVGESSGTLAKNFLYLADELKKSKDIQNKVRSAMVYPLVILIATVGVTGFLTFFVFPKLLPMFSSLNVKLPVTTVIMINTLEFLRIYFVHIIVGVAVLIIGGRMLVKHVMPVKFIVDKMILFIPVVGPLSVHVNIVNFTRVLGLLLKSGVKIVEAVSITSNTFENLVYKRALIEAMNEVQKGGQLATYMVEKKRYFPPLVMGMIRVGENTGNLEENLDYLSEYYEDEVDTRLHTLTSILEPILLLFMGFLVGFVALSIVTPIYSISQGIK
jgi:type IV pilus assembly protein PilC